MTGFLPLSKEASAFFAKFKHTLRKSSKKKWNPKLNFHNTGGVPRASQGSYTVPTGKLQDPVVVCPNTAFKPEPTPEMEP